MRTSKRSVRRSLGAGLSSIGIVFLLVAGLLVVFELPGAAQTAPTTLTVNKVVLGSAGVNDFQLLIDGNPVAWHPAVHTVSPGLHTVSESWDMGAFPGYTTFISGACASDGSITVVEGQAAQCTITNLYTPPPPPDPTVTLTKTFAGDALPAGVTQADFTPGGFAGAAWGTTSVVPGTYTVTETGAPGPGTWGSPSIVCTGTGTSSTGALAPGDAVTCSITNTYTAPTTGTVTLTKVFVGNTVGATQGDFTPTLGGAGASWGANTVPFDTYAVGETSGRTGDAGTWTVTDDCGGSVTVAIGAVAACTITNTYSTTGTVTLIKEFVGNTVGATQDDFTPTLGGVDMVWGANTVTAGTYSVGETNQRTGDDGTWNNDDNCSSSVTVAVGAIAACTITNTFTPRVPDEPTLTVTKVVEGGTSTVGDFALNVGGTPVVSGESNSFAPGTYTVGETGGPTWYSAVVSGNCAANGSITMVVDESYECTITNTFIPPTLTITKTVIGAANPDDFLLRVIRVSGPSDPTGVLSGESNGFSPGEYYASETLLEGYVAGDWGGDCDVQGVVQLVGGPYECTITNSETPTLTLIKTVVGGSAAPDDFLLTVTPLGGAPTTGVLSGVGTEFAPGTYVPGETLLDGYTAGPWGGDCEVIGENGTATAAVTLAYGEHKTCTITNTDPLPRLTLTKIVIGGGNSPDDFNLRVVGQVTTAVVSGATNMFDPGTYTAVEDNLPGYAAGDWDGACDPATGEVTLPTVIAGMELSEYFLECSITNIATTTTTTSGGTTTTGGTTPTTTPFATTTTDPGDTTTTTLVLGAQLPNTGGGNLFPTLLGGIGLMLLGAGLVLLAPRRYPRWAA